MARARSGPLTRGLGLDGAAHEPIERLFDVEPALQDRIDRGRDGHLEAVRGGQAIAGSLFLETEHGLYGRYWGCDEEIEFLHFEAAYYAGIERCIERKLPLFEAGAQGEHKLLRGFMPVICHSAHELKHPGLDRGVRDFLREEARAVAQHVRELAEYGPYKHDQC